jgi:hypothetical protein
MARRRTLPQNIRKYKQEYLRLLAYEARLNHQLFKMKKRIKLLAQEEQLRLTEKALLSEQLQKVQQQKEELESQPACKQRTTQLKRVEKEYKQVKARHSRNQYQLDQLEVKKDKDNAVKLLLKEAKCEDVTVRIQRAYETWMKLEQMAQYEAIRMEIFQAISADLSVEQQPIASQKLVEKRNRCRKELLSDLLTTHEEMAFGEKGGMEIIRHCNFRPVETLYSFSYLIGLKG